MEGHEVAPDVVDVAPADVIKVSFTQIVQGSESLNRLSAFKRHWTAVQSAKLAKSAEECKKKYSVDY